MLQDWVHKHVNIRQSAVPFYFIFTNLIILIGNYYGYAEDKPTKYGVFTSETFIYSKKNQAY